MIVPNVMPRLQSLREGRLWCTLYKILMSEMDTNKPHQYRLRKLITADRGGTIRGEWVSRKE